MTNVWVFNTLKPSHLRETSANHSMGPILIFDKSTLESLNPDEAVWLDNFFVCNITPLFFVETLADLEKQVRKGRTPESVVGNLAYKTPDMHSRPNVHHQTLLVGELSGAGIVEMKYGRPIISGGRTVELEGRTGIIFRQTPEEEAFDRWQKGEFLGVERLIARAWRKGLAAVDLDDHYRFFQSFFPLGKPKTLADVKRFVDFHIDGPDQEKVFKFGLSLLGVPSESQATVIDRWTAAGKPSIRTFAPYFTHVFSVDLFFYLGIAADQISRERPSHKIDLAYLYYLPFCMVFTSNDKLHASIAPFFLREDQSFIPGSDLKVDFGRLDSHYSALPEEEKISGLMSFASYPPPDDSFLVTRLWDRHMNPKWREHRSQPKPELNSEASKAMIDLIRRFQKESTPVGESGSVNSDTADHITIERMVRGKKGKWVRFPPEVLNRRKNEAGEWEDPEDKGQF